jgi:rhodanese-related sulfurtransferase
VHRRIPIRDDWSQLRGNRPQLFDERSPERVQQGKAPRAIHIDDDSDSTQPNSE